MFSSSLHKRSDWASIPSILLSQQQPKWQGEQSLLILRPQLTQSTESTLDNHDLCIPVPNSSNKREQELFRIILVSSQELQTSGDALQRIERLFHQYGGRNVGIVYLLTPNHAGTIGFMNLQLRQAHSYTEIDIAKCIQSHG